MKYVVNGKVYDSEHILIPLEDNGAFLYGDGFFESGRIINGKWMWKEYHWERIKNSFDLLKMNDPFTSPDDLNKQALQVAGAANSRLRISFWRNSSGGYSAGTSTNYLIQTIPFGAASYPLNEKGLKLCLYKELLKPLTPLSNLKSNSSQICVLATRYAQDKGVDESILFNSAGRIAETNRSNIWIVKNKVIKTPPLSDACLNGVMRMVILDIIHKTNYELQEGNITEGALYEADEVFISGSVRGIQWVEEMEGKSYTEKEIATFLSGRLNSLISS